LLAGEDSNPH